MRILLSCAFLFACTLPLEAQQIADPESIPVAPGPTSPLLQPDPPSLIEQTPSDTPPPEASETPPDIEAQFQDFPELNEEDLLKPGRLVTAAQKRVQMRKARSRAETDEEVRAAWLAAQESPTYAGRREWMTAYYQRLCNRMRRISPSLRPEIDRLEIDSIEALQDLPGDPDDTLDAYVTPR